MHVLLNSEIETVSGGLFVATPVAPTPLPLEDPVFIPGGSPIATPVRPKPLPSDEPVFTPA